MEINDKNSEEIIVIDSHTHAGGVDFYNLFIPRYPIAQSVEDLIFKMDCLNINYAIVLPMPFPMYYDPRKINNNKWFKTNLEKFPYQLLNSALLYEAENYRNRLFPFFAIDPRERVKEQVKFLEKNIRENKIFGLKLHTLATNSSAQKLEKTGFVDLLEEYDLPIIIHSDHRFRFTSPFNALKFAERHPKIRVCIAHLAGFDRSVLKIARGMENVFFDTAPFLTNCNLAIKRIEGYVSREMFNTNYKNPIEALIEFSEYLKGKLMWGSDEPWTKISDPQGNRLTKFSYKDERTLLSGVIQHKREDLMKEIAMINPLRFIFGNRIKKNKFIKNN